MALVPQGNFFITATPITGNEYASTALTTVKVGPRLDAGSGVTSQTITRPASKIRMNAKHQSNPTLLKREGSKQVTQITMPQVR